MQIKVVNNQVEKALQILKKQMIREGVFKELKKRKYYMKPSLKRKVKRETAEKTRIKDIKKSILKAKMVL